MVHLIDRFFDLLAIRHRFSIKAFVQRGSPEVPFLQLACPISRWGPRAHRCAGRGSRPLRRWRATQLDPGCRLRGASM